MTSGGAEAFKAAIRRSIWLVVVCALVGVGAVDLIKQLEGPRYAASVSVLISTAPLSRIVTGTEPPYVDPQRIQDTAQALAGSPQVYRLAEKSTHGWYGNASQLASAVSVSIGGNNDLLYFTAHSKKPAAAVGIVNAVAAQYIVFRNQLSGGAASQAIAQIKAQLRQVGPNSPIRAGLETQLSNLQILHTLTGADYAVVARANGAWKTTPAPVHDTLLGLSLGLVIGLLLAAVREAVDTKVRSEADVEALLSTPVLAALPAVPRRQRHISLGRGRQPFVETYALLAANVANTRRDDGWNVLAVTSAISREGKTTTAVNLALALARRGLNVCLADFDFRKPMVGATFELHAYPGILQVLAGELDLDDVLWLVQDGKKPSLARDNEYGIGAVSATNGSSESAPALHLLLVGGSVNSEEIVHSSSLPGLLRDLRRRFDIVILDTPPALLTVEMTDLGSLIDAMLVVVRQGEVTHRALRSFSERAKGWPIEVVGAVLTGVPAQETYGAGYGYGGR